MAGAVHARPSGQRIVFVSADVTLDLHGAVGWMDEKFLDGHSAGEGEKALALGEVLVDVVVPVRRRSMSMSISKYTY